MLDGWGTQPDVGARDVIHQFAELGSFFGVRDGATDALHQYAQDPAQQAKGKTVLVIVFGAGGFEDVLIEEYDDSRRLRYLYRQGPSNGCDATPTSPMATWDPKKDGSFAQNVGTRVKRLGKSAREALRTCRDVADWETEALGKLADLDRGLPGILAVLARKFTDPKVRGVLTLGWRGADGQLRRVGDFEAFKQRLVTEGERAASEKKGAGKVEGAGQCSICGARDVPVSGLLQVPKFRFYTIDKRGSISGGFREGDAWRNFPACKKCSDAASYAGERVQKELSFDYYGFRYIVLPAPVVQRPTEAFDLLDRLTRARISDAGRKRLTDAEDELFYVVSCEKNIFQVDLLFYKPSPQYFRPALYLSGLLPMHFRRLFEAKDSVDAHPWNDSGAPPGFAGGTFSFGSLRRVLPSEFDEDFLKATRAALELAPFSRARLLAVGLRQVRAGFPDGSKWAGRLADIFRSLMFFEVLCGLERSAAQMDIDYGDSPQSDRVRKVIEECTGKLRSDVAAQAALLVGACCRRIENIQQRRQGARPFTGKYKGLHLSQPEIQGLFVQAKAKALEYGDDDERTVDGLLRCAGAALAGTPEEWALTRDEVSYYFALGHALSARFAAEKEGIHER